MLEPSLQDLISTYQNEKCTETLLPYASETVDHFLTLIQRQMEALDSIDMSVVRNIHELEMERVRYFLKEYIQTRLRKLNENLYIDPSLMSEQELVFHRKYIGLLRETDVYVEKQESCRRHEFVGFYCLVDINSIEIDGDVLEMFKGDFFIAPLDDVAELLKRGEVILF